MSSQAITYELLTSFQRHVLALWGSDKYTLSGASTQEGFCPAALDELLTYTDKHGQERIFGPCEVIVGRYLPDNPTNLANNLAVPSCYIELMENDPDASEGWRHSLYRAVDSAQALENLPVLSIGGESRFFRRFCVKTTTYFLDADLSADEVARLGNAASSFLESMLTSYVDMPYAWAWHFLDGDNLRIVDPFGERPHRSLPVLSHSRRRGGPPNDYIWDIKIYVEVATFKDTE